MWTNNAWENNDLEIEVLEEKGERRGCAIF